MKWILVPVLLSVGCSGSDSDDEVLCFDGRGTVSGKTTHDPDCIYTADDARVEFVRVGQDAPLIVRPNAEGVYSVDVEPGEWEIRGFGWDDSCMVEEPILVTVESCSSQTVDVCASVCFG